MICRAVVMHFNEQTHWGKLVYAQDDHGRDIIDALSAALVVKANDVARGLRNDGLYKTFLLKELEFHSTSVDGGWVGRIPAPGQLVDVILNVDDKLVSVRYHQRPR